MKFLELAKNDFFVFGESARAMPTLAEARFLQNPGTLGSTSGHR